MGVKLSGYVVSQMGLAEGYALIYMLVNTTAVRSGKLWNVPQSGPATGPEGKKGMESILRIKGT